MSKIKKSITVVTALLLMTSGLSINANEVFMPRLTKCENFALDYLEAYEYQFGDVGAEQANWIYSTQLFFCENPI